MFVVVVAGYAALAASGFMAWDFFYRERFAMLATAFVLGLAFTCAVVLPAPRPPAKRCSPICTSDGCRTRSGSAGASTRRCCST